MKSSVVVLMTLAAFGFSGAAFAGQATKPAAMSDAQMDKVTAGDPGNGNAFAGGGFGADQAISAKLGGNNATPGGNSAFGHTSPGKP